MTPVTLAPAQARQKDRLVLSVGRIGKRGEENAGGGSIQGPGVRVHSMVCTGQVAGLGSWKSVGDSRRKDEEVAGEVYSWCLYWYRLVTYR